MRGGCPCGVSAGECAWLAQDLLVHEVVEERARLYQDKVAVEVVHDTLLRRASEALGQDRASEVAADAYTYGEIDSLSRSLANTLACSVSADVEDETNVVVLLEEGVGLVVCELGVLKSGASFVPVDPNWPAERQAFIVRDCQASAVLLPRDRAQTLKANLVREGITFADGEGMGVGNVVGLVWEDLVGTPGGEVLLPSPRHLRLPAPRGLIRRNKRCSHVIYTSGTSGAPKGVICEHAGLVAYMHAKCQTHRILPYPETPAGNGKGQAARPSRVLLTSAPTWDPSLGDIFSTLGAGAVLCLAPRAALVSHLREVLNLSRASHVLTTAPLWDLLGESAGPEDVPHLEVLALGGAPFPRHYISRGLGAHRRTHLRAYHCGLNFIGMGVVHALEVD